MISIRVQFGRYKDGRPMFSVQDRTGLTVGIELTQESLWGVLKQIEAAARTLPEEPSIPDGWEYLVGAS